MIRLTPKTFQEFTDSKELRFVVFTTLDCAPCAEIKKSISELVDLEKSFGEFQVKQLGSDKIVKDFRVNILPRVVAFYGGKEVGRFAGYRTPEDIMAKITEFIKTGKIDTEDTDADEVCFFYERVKKALGWNFKRDFPYAQWQEKADKMMEISHSIIKSKSDWFSLDDKALESLVVSNNI